jgi:hypothetical protein
MGYADFYCNSSYEFSMFDKKMYQLWGNFDKRMCYIVEHDER